jgi:hypothetical protein
MANRASMRQLSLAKALIRWDRLSVFVSALMAAIVALTGCSVFRSRADREERDSRQNVFPANYKADLTAAMHAYLTDPTNIRDAYVTDPAIRNVDERNRYSVCLRFNAKNSDGRYAGSRDMLAIFVGGRFNQFVDPTITPDQPKLATLLMEQCGQADYKRFPELEALTR